MACNPAPGAQLLRRDVQHAFRFHLLTRAHAHLGLTPLAGAADGCLHDFVVAAANAAVHMPAHRERRTHV